MPSRTSYARNSWIGGMPGSSIYDTAEAGNSTKMKKGRHFPLPLSLPAQGNMTRGPQRLNLESISPSRESSGLEEEKEEAKLTFACTNGGGDKDQDIFSAQQ